MKRKRPSVVVNCVADKYAVPGERIVEFGFGDGFGGLISLRTLQDGTHVVDVYRCLGVVVRTDKSNLESAAH